ncbi:MAG: MarR family transcriptional regulator [Deltaproteobacteria bacterium]|nr:MarR family transcriptional regulator [Deltaproteobacteria bacterium]
MREKQIDGISESALQLFPLLKRLFNADPSDPALAPLRNQTYSILRILERSGPLSLSAVGRQLIIAKQNMTTIVDKLMKDGLVERRYDANDRRVINVLITEKGIRFLKESMLGLKNIVRINLSELSDEDIESLYKALQTVRNIAPKLC